MPIFFYVDMMDFSLGTPMKGREGQQTIPHLSDMCKEL